MNGWTWLLIFGGVVILSSLIFGIVIAFAIPGIIDSFKSLFNNTSAQLDKYKVKLKPFESGGFTFSTTEDPMIKQDSNYSRTTIDVSDTKVIAIYSSYVFSCCVTFQTSNIDLNPPPPPPPKVEENVSSSTKIDIDNKPAKLWISIHDPNVDTNKISVFLIPENLVQYIDMLDKQ